MPLRTLNHLIAFASERVRALREPLRILQKGVARAPHSIATAGLVAMGFTVGHHAAAALSVSAR